MLRFGYRRAKPLYWVVQQLYHFRWYSITIQTGADSTGVRQFKSEDAAIDYAHVNMVGWWRVKAVKN